MPLATQAATHQRSSVRPLERPNTRKNTATSKAEEICTAVLQRQSSSSSMRP
jgi:hypothetical protein